MTLDAIQKTDNSINILGVHISSTDMTTALARLKQEGVFREGRGMVMVFTPTVEQIVMAVHDPDFATVLNEADMNVADATGLVLADWWLSKRQPRPWRLQSRVPGIDLSWKLAVETLKGGKKVFLLGGSVSAADLAARQLLRYASRFLKNLQYDEGSRDITHETNIERERVLRRISEFKPELLLVAYGAPQQERWVYHNRRALEESGVKVAMVVGGAFDVWAGYLPRAPLPIRKIGMEWLWRLMLEPWRFKRQLRLLEFVKLVLSYS